MSSSNINQNASECSSEESPNVQAETNGEGEPEAVPKIWNINDPLQYEPPRPDGDPWDVLLDPLMKKDKMRCDAWKDEVQNLLIFAGLFSAVVTAFIVESYKNLQPDPNDAIINILSHIATRLDGSLNSSSTLPPSVVQPFSVDASSVRVNAFWFISLVLNLTTVLVGIVSLQWLREHQSYSTDLTSREKYAMCIMRADGLKNWQVDKIFTMLPLLLQCALILFLGGVIDFLSAIGNRNVVVPVTVFVMLPLIFLVMTTILPCLQVSLLYSNVSLKRDRSIGRPWKVPPSQCPFKSPQSHAVRNLWLSLLRLRATVRFKLYQYDLWGHSSTSRTMPWDGTPDSHFTRYLYAASVESKWIDYDLAWLAIRDGYMRRFFKRSSGSEYVARTDVAPIFDIVYGLNDQRYYTSLFPSAYHCFAEISKLALQPVHTFGFGNLGEVCRQSAYLHNLVASNGEPILPDCFSLQSLIEIDQSVGTDTSPAIQTLSTILHQQNMDAFIPYYQSTRGDALPSILRTELRLRLLRYTFQEGNTFRSVDPQFEIPDCLVLHWYHAQVIGNTVKDKEVFNATAWQIANFTLSILQRIAEEPSLDSLAQNALVQRILPYMETSGYYAARTIAFDNAPSSLIDEYHSVFNYIEELLVKEMSSWSAANSRPSLLFYTSALFAHFIISQLDWNTARTATYSSFLSICSAICCYRERTIDVGMFDSVIEEQLRKKMTQAHSELTIPFSPLWWDELSIHNSSDPTSRHSAPP